MNLKQFGVKIEQISKLQQLKYTVLTQYCSENTVAKARQKRRYCSKVITAVSWEPHCSIHPIWKKYTAFIVIHTPMCRPCGSQLFDFGEFQVSKTANYAAPPHPMWILSLGMILSTIKGQDAILLKLLLHFFITLLGNL